MTPGALLIDTDVIVEYLRGRERAVAYMQSLGGSLYVSAITIAELYAGVRSGEQSALEEFLSAFEVIDVDQTIGRDGGLCMRDYRAAYGTKLADAVIAASAQALGASLVTFNAKHFPMVRDVVVPYHRNG
jgi:predicted nucleic acid-binding protein